MVQLLGLHCNIRCCVMSRWGTFLLSASCTTSSCSPCSDSVDRSKPFLSTAPGNPVSPLCLYHALFYFITDKEIKLDCVHSEHTLSSTGHLRTRGYCQKCPLLFSWPSRLAPWSCQFTPLSKSKNVLGTETCLTWNMEGTLITHKGKPHIISLCRCMNKNNILGCIRDKALTVYFEGWDLSFLESGAPCTTGCIGQCPCAEP